MKRSPTGAFSAAALLYLLVAMPAMGSRLPSAPRSHGSDWFISGAPHRRWNNTALHTLGEVEGRHFKVVDTSQLPRP